jgi:superfamily II DNA or RNA helicase
MKIRELGALFPSNQIVASCYDMKTAKEIEKEYKIIEDEIARLKNCEIQSSCALSRILYARMRIEQLKIPTFIEEAKKYLEENNHVAIFVNFSQTIKTLAKELNTKCIIWGDQTIEERSKNIQDFSDDLQKVIICSSKSGGVGISLHDIHGNYPRVSIISPSFSAQDIIQVLGRIHRANTKTACRQRIIFCKDTIEESICENMKVKIQNIAMLNDGDLLSYNIEGMTDDFDSIGIDRNSSMSEFDKIFLKISVLQIKKERLLQELKETDEEIKKLEIIVYDTMGSEEIEQLDRFKEIDDSDFDKMDPMLFVD